MLYLGHGDSSSNTRTLILADEPVESGTVVAPGSDFVTLEFISADLPEKILHNGPFILSLDFAKTGDLNIIPSMYLRDSDPATPDILIFSGNRLTTIEYPYTMSWSNNMSTDADLSDYSIVLKLIIGNEPTFTDSSLTFSPDCSISVDVREGSRIENYLHSEVIFAVFQKRIIGSLHSEVSVKEEITGSLHSRVINIEDVSSLLYTSTQVYSEQSGIVYSETTLNTGVPRISDLTLGDYRLKEGALHKNNSLESVADEFITLPNIYIPPPVPQFSGEEKTLLDHFVADNLVVLSEDINLSSIGSMPGNLVNFYMPSTLYAGTYQLRNGEWQLPDDFLDSEDYTVTFEVEPYVLAPDLQPVPLNNVSAIYFMFRHRDVGAHITAALEGVTGSLILNKEVSSVENALAWVWHSPIPPYRITVYASNSTPLLPGLAGRSALSVVTV